MFSPLHHVVDLATHVTIDRDAIESVAEWMAYEELPWPNFRLPMYPDLAPNDLIDFIFWTATINFAFTDFESHRMFTVELDGSFYSDSDAMMACLNRALREGHPILEGAFWASTDRDVLDQVFRGDVPMPMLNARHDVLKNVGAKLEADFDGRFHRFLDLAPRHAFGDDGGLVDALVESFPSFRDVSLYGGREVWFHKRAQLLLWQLHSRFSTEGVFALEDPEDLTAFADYIVPVALRVLDILRYSERLENRINAFEPLEAHGSDEVEIRAASLVACRWLREAINARRPPERQIIDPVLDTRLWTHYHRSHWPHHLSETTAY